MKIVYCTDSLCYAGGIQTVTIAKANALSKIEGNKVWIIVTDHKNKPVGEIFPQVNIVNLNINYSEDDWKGYFYVLKGIFIKRRLHKKALETALNKIQPDIVISTGTSEKYFLPQLKINSNPKYIREIHFPSDYRRRHAYTLRDKITAYLGDWYDFQWKIKSYDRIALLTDKDMGINWKNNSKVIVMPNPVTSKCAIYSTGNNKVAISVGRLEEVKNFDGLIRIWGEVAKTHPDWILNIWGNGSLESSLNNQIQQKGLTQNIKLCGYSYHVMEEMAKSSIYIMTSHFEGFPSVLVEAMSVGVPPISYDCPYGPSAIINNGETGYLINPNKEDEMVQKINYLIEHPEIRKAMKETAKKDIIRFSPEIIANKWMEVFNSIK